MNARLSRSRAYAALAAAALALAALAAVCGEPQEDATRTAALESATVETRATGEDPVARFGTPRPQATPVRSVVPPDTENPPRCLYPVDERPAPDLPPYSCRYSDSEPLPGVISPPTESDVRLPAQVPRDWQVIDNRLFRMSLAIPPDWYSNMRPEGGEFELTDLVATEELVHGVDLAVGGTLIHVTAQEFSRITGDIYVPVAEEHLRSPNMTFAGVPGAIWEEPPGEGLARIINAAYWVDGVLFAFRIHVQDDGRPASVVQQDVDVVTSVLNTVTPY